MNSQNKQQAIKAAYGEYYKDYRRFIDENGFIYQSDLFFPETGMKKDGVEAEIISVEKKHKWSNIKWRPMSLQGLENNQGWTRIENEEDMPKEYKNYWCRTYNGDTKILRFDPEFKEWYYECNTGLSFTVTHYQPIETPNPPIF